MKAPLISADSDEAVSVQVDRIRVPIWVERPFQLVSWWAVERFSAEQFYSVGRLIEQLRTYADPGPFLLDNPVNKAVQECVVESVGAIERHCAAIGLRQSQKACNRLLSDYSDRVIGDLAITNRRLLSFLDTVGELVASEMEENLFLHIPPHRAERYGKRELFGPAVAASFPSSGFDISEAGSCFASGRYTACVFHLMRALELALVAFAEEVKTDQRENWQQLIEGIEKKLREMGRSPKTPAEKAKFEQYNQAASSFMIFKDAWRNYTAHARGKYVEEEADAVFRNVCSFMQKLAACGLHE